MGKIWRKLFPVRERTVIVQGSAGPQLIAWQADILIATPSGKIVLVCRRELGQDFVIQEIGYYNAR